MRWLTLALLLFAVSAASVAPDSDQLKQAQDLVAHLDKLTEQKRTTFVSLGDYAFQAVVPLVRERMAACDAAAEKGEEESAACSAFQEAAGALHCVASPERTDDMIALYRECKTSDTRGELLCALRCRGDKDRVVPFMIGILQDVKAAPRERSMAFSYLSETENDSAAKAVLAFREATRTVPPLAEAVKLADIGTQPMVIKPDEFVWRWEKTTRLLDTKKDEDGVLWGRFSSLALGSDEDVWIARYDGAHWTGLTFTGKTRKQVGKDWLKTLTADSAAAKDSDGDGLTDLVEKRLGTNPAKPDTDGDGLSDSKDRNPLAAPRTLSEGEQVLAAVFEGRFRFYGGFGEPALLELPKGIKAMEFGGWDWLTIVHLGPGKSPLADATDKGLAIVSFHYPASNFAGKRIPKPPKGRVILWNKDRTEALVQVATYYGSTNGTGYDVRVRRIGDQWVVVGMHMAWIS